MTFSDVFLWLQERTALGILPETVLRAIAPQLQLQVIPANHKLVVEDSPPTGLYILQEGQLEGERDRQNVAAWGLGFLPGATINLQELLLNQLTQRTIVALTECHLAFIPAAQFQELVAQFPEISQVLSQQLALELEQLSSQFNYEQERQTILRPYLMTKVKRGIVGKSRYANRLRQQIKQATEDRRPAIVFGEPGLEKDNISALIHFGSPMRRQPVIKINCSTLLPSGADLFGRVGGKSGLLEWLGEGTLILNNIQELPPELIPKLAGLLATGNYTPVPAENSDSQGENDKIPCQSRILMISEKSLPAVEKLVGHVIKVPPLRVRKADIGAQVKYYIKTLCRSRNIPCPAITPEALRRLQAYDFPGNLRELQGLVERAIAQSAGAKELTEEVFWSVATKKKLFRVNLLNAYPGLRRFLRSSWWPDRINYGFTFTFFAFIVGVLFFGSQHRHENFALNMFWAWWWPLILLGFPFVGRLWCAVCPFMIYGEITQKLSLKLFPRQLKGWPRQTAEKWGGWFLFGLFVLIYLWEELWNLPDTAYLSACLLLLITAGAMIFSAIFERRFWCRYLCPIGGMNGLFAKLSTIELRAQQGICSASCTTYQCYKGGPPKGEGLETMGCPVYSHPAQLQDNKDCVLCMTCLKACPHRSVELNLRPPGIELWTTHTPHAYEVALLFLLLGGVYLHRLPELQTWLGWQIDLHHFWVHLGFSGTVLIVPALVIWFAYGGIWLVHGNAKPRSFIELAYGYLPLVWGGNLAHYLNLGLEEAGKVLPLTLATFGMDGAGLPAIVAHPAVIDFLQGATLIFSALMAIWLTQKIAKQSMRSLFPQHLSIILLAATLWAVILG